MEDTVRKRKRKKPLKEPTTSTSKKEGKGEARKRTRNTSQNETRGTSSLSSPGRDKRKKKHKQHLDIRIEVEARTGRTTRVVSAVDGDGNLVHRHKFDVDRSDERRRFLKDLSERLKVDAECLLQYDQHIVALAEEADQGAYEEAADRHLPNPAPYRLTEHGLVYDKPHGDSVMPIPLTNFGAAIEEEITEDDGFEKRRVFAIRGRRDDETYEFRVPASKFDALCWVTEEMGSQAVIYAGFGSREHTKVAIRLVRKPTRRQVYRHTGWRRIDGQHLYLHGGGAVGPKGPAAGVEVELSGELTRYILPEVPERETLKDRIRATLDLRQLGPLSVTCCPEGATFRAALGGECDTTLWLTGETGSGKSELVARYQQHFGRAMDRTGLPASWLSTGNALETSASCAKDALFVIDDFCPRGPAGDISRYNKTADRVIRAARNKAGRQRMWADGTLRPTRYPRGIIVGTGEDVPTGHSLRAGMMIVELPKSGMDWALLTGCQAKGAAGAYAATMAGFLRFVSRNFDKVQDGVRRKLREFRAKASASAAHRRTPDLVANLATGCYFFLRYAEAKRAITDEERRRLFEEAWRAIGQAAAQQDQYLRSARPELRFLELLCSAISSGEAHLAGLDGERPKSPQVAKAYGWRCSRTGLESKQWTYQGKRIGWIADELIYLDSEAAYKVAQEMARHGEAIPVQSKTLHKRLADSGLLAKTEKDRGKLTVRKKIAGDRRHVLCIKADYLCR
ncbi:MAG: hypothetical protein RIC55_00085 [Pirellulaceae bacterium]